MMMRNSVLCVNMILLCAAAMACSPKVKTTSSANTVGKPGLLEQVQNEPQAAPKPMQAPGEVDPLITPGSPIKPRTVPANALPMEPWKK